VPAFAAAALGRLTVERSLPDRVAVSGLPGSRPLTCLAFGDPISGERAASSPTSCYTIMSLPASQQYRNLRPPTDTSPPVNATGVRPALISCQAVRDRFPGLGTARSRSWSSQPEDGAGGGRGLSHGCGDAEGEQGDQGKVEHRPGGGAQHRPVAQRQRRVAACRGEAMRGAPDPATDWAADHADRRGQGPAGLQPWAKAVIIITASTRPGSAYAAMMVTAGHGVRMQYDYTGDIAGPGRPSGRRGPALAAPDPLG
jgi:hypothetical protein